MSVKAGEKVTIKHTFAHWLGLNTGKIVSEWDVDGWLWVGFKCDQCGKISVRHRTRTASKR